MQEKFVKYENKIFSFEFFNFSFLINKDFFLTTGTKQQRKTQIFYACQETQKSSYSGIYSEVLSYVIFIL